MGLPEISSRGVFEKDIWFGGELVVGIEGQWRAWSCSAGGCEILGPCLGTY